METKDWGKTISYIRKNKNIPIKQVIGEKLQGLHTQDFLQDKLIRLLINAFSL